MIPDTPKTLLHKIAEYANGDDAAEWARFVELYTPVIRAFIGARGEGETVSAEDVEILDETPDAAEHVDRHLREARHAAAVEHVLARTMLDARTVAAYRAYALEERPADEVVATYGLTLNALRQIKYRVGHMIAATETQYGE